MSNRYRSPYREAICGFSIDPELPQGEKARECELCAKERVAQERQANFKGLAK